MYRSTIAITTMPHQGFEHERVLLNKDNKHGIIVLLKYYVL